eukprot:gnl/MRDRNA2_/MRDRNA2_24201_c0_seq2.p1 gnl/MRDRNA2_/MRDRNA2_24201_c0~~gnl/MRDRNA2_/MRDRNA2_24201_c0_seq2.p1  ORF type:complete len:246 (+),score=17.10 gnl/MRDRNA2_/MRDRNA2_24201_c0_seq2:93-830(+)
MSEMPEREQYTPLVGVQSSSAVNGDSNGTPNLTRFGTKAFGEGTQFEEMRMFPLSNFTDATSTESKFGINFLGLIGTCIGGFFSFFMPEFGCFILWCILFAWMQWAHVEHIREDKEVEDHVVYQNATNRTVVLIERPGAEDTSNEDELEEVISNGWFVHFSIHLVRWLTGILLIFIVVVSMNYGIIFLTIDLYPRFRFIPRLLRFFFCSWRSQKHADVKVSDENESEARSLNKDGGWRTRQSLVS